jgi:prepilin peptidase CpaA
VTTGGWTDVLESAPQALALLLATVAAVTDIARNRVPNLLTFPAAAVGLVLGALRGGLPGLGLALAGLIVGVGFLFIPFAARWIHGGDVKLLGAIGALLGPEKVLWTFLLSSVFGGLFAVAMLVVTRRGRGKLSIWWTKLKIWLLTRDVTVLKPGGEGGTIYLPYAVPIALGTLASWLAEGTLY